jgi:excisionase family DNA binding protein
MIDYWGKQVGKKINKQDPGPRRRMLSMAAVAEQFDVSERTIRRWIAAGQLSAYRIGTRTVRLDAAEVDAIVHKVPTTRRAG